MGNCLCFLVPDDDDEESRPVNQPSQVPINYQLITGTKLLIKVPLSELGIISLYWLCIIENCSIIFQKKSMRLSLKNHHHSWAIFIEFLN